MWIMSYDFRYNGLQNLSFVVEIVISRYDQPLLPMEALLQIFSSIDNTFSLLLSQWSPQRGFAPILKFCSLDFFFSAMLLFSSCVFTKPTLCFTPIFQWKQVVTILRICKLNQHALSSRNALNDAVGCVITDQVELHRE